MRDLITLSTSKGHDIRILDRSAVKYREIGAILLKDDTGAIVEAIREGALGDPIKAITVIYGKWIQEHENHSWKTLARCLRDVQLNPLAIEIERHFGLPSPSDQGMLIVYSRLNS